MTGCIAMINAGSSSVKFAIYDAASEEHCLFRGQIAGIGLKPRLTIADVKGATVENRSFAFEGFDMMLAGSESAARADPGHLVDLIEVDENTGLRAWILPVEPAVRSDLAALMRYRLSRAIRGGRWSQSEGHFGAIAGKTIA